MELKNDDKQKYIEMIESLLRELGRGNSARFMFIKHRNNLRELLSKLQSS